MLVELLVSGGVFFTCAIIIKLFFKTYFLEKSNIKNNFWTNLFEKG